MRARDLMKQRYAFGEVRQRLARLDRVVHLAYDSDPNRVIGDVQRRAFARDLREMAAMLRDAAGVIEPAPRTIPVNPADPLGPRMLDPSYVWGEMSPAARAKLFSPVENAKMAKHLFDRERADAWRGSTFPTIATDYAEFTAGVIAANPSVDADSPTATLPLFTASRVKRPWLCRLGLHDRRVVDPEWEGESYIGAGECARPGCGKRWGGPEGWRAGR